MKTNNNDFISACSCFYDLMKGKILNDNYNSVITYRNIGHIFFLI